MLGFRTAGVLSIVVAVGASSRNVAAGEVDGVAELRARLDAIEANNAALEARNQALQKSNTERRND